MLYAISDLHLDHLENRRALERLAPHPDDWLILAGDIGHREEDVRQCFQLLAQRFRKLVWAPGNHDLWSPPADSRGPRGEEKYLRLVAMCREHGILTPEDPYALFEEDGVSYTVAPLFLLYDYSFGPDHLSPEEAVRWAMQEGILCADEFYLSPHPYSSRSAWCEARCRLTEERLAAVPSQSPLILINHFPLRRDLVRMKIPRFRVWCGTRRTEEWHTRFKVAVVVTGHLHVRATDWRDAVRFEEVSLGYPRQWRGENGIGGYLRRILPSTGPGE